MPGESFVIKWEAYDGYAGGGRPQSVEITIDDVIDFDVDNADHDTVSEIVQEDFADKVSWAITNKDELNAWIAEVKAARED